MATPVYNEIRELTGQLRRETKVRPRRLIGATLHKKLANEDIRRKLALEATPATSRWPDEDSIAAKRCHAMQGVWSSVIYGAIHVTQSIQSKKGKLTQDDVTLPFRLLKACDAPTTAFEDDCVSIPKLPKKTVRSLLKYCLGLLQQEQIVDLAGVQLLEMLTFLCGRIEFVGVFQYLTDFSVIVDELYIHIDAEIDKNNYILYEEACKAMDTLFASCRELGMETIQFIDPVLECISRRCETYLHDVEANASTARLQGIALPHLVKTTTTMLFSHPDHAIGPMKRYGRNFLRYCTRRYPLETGVSKDALNAYFLAHLFIAQTAGVVQGQTMGRLGDLGEASLDREAVEGLLDVVIAEVQRLFGTEQTPSDVRKRKVLVWTPLDSRQQQLLELAARLMACAQQEYIGDAQWKTIENPTTAMLSSLKLEGAGDDEWIEQNTIAPRPCSQETLLGSPWMRHILIELAQAVSSQEAGKIAVPLQGNAGTSTELSPEHELQQMVSHLRIPTIPSGASGLSIQAFLPLIGACAELYPSGQCWTSDVVEGVQRLSPRDPLLEDVLYCASGSTDDLALIVFLLSKLLVDYGGAGGDYRIQCWLLVCCAKLSETTYLHYQHSLQNPDSLTPLQTSWRLVWNTIFRSDLRYQSYTKAVLPGGLGGLVLALVRDITKFRCTDVSCLSSEQLANKQRNSFLYHHQHQIWSLPAFSNSTGWTSAVALELTCWVIQVAGISDLGNDSIRFVANLPSFSGSTTSIPTFEGQTNRRVRLVRLALDTLIAYIDADKLRGQHSRDFVAMATASIVTLVTGSLPYDVSTLSSTGNVPLIRGDADAEEASCMVEPNFKHTAAICTTCQASRSQQRTNNTLVEPCFEKLWVHPEQNALPSREFVPTHVDIVSRAACLLRTTVPVPFCIRSADSVSESELLHLRRCVLGAAQGVLRRESFESEMSPDESTFTGSEDTPHSLPLSQQTLVSKCVLSLLVVCPEAHLRKEKHELAAFTRTFAGYCSTIVQVPDLQEFHMGATHTLQLAFALLQILSVVHLTTVIDLSRQVNDFKKVLDAYTSKQSTRTKATTRTKLDTRGTTRAVDDNLMDDDADVLPPARFASQVRPSSAETRVSGQSSESEDSLDQHTRRKRARSSISSSASKRTRLCDVAPATVMNHANARLVGLILLAVEPSPNNCSLVCRALLGADLDLDPTDLNGDVDMRGARCCTQTLLAPHVLLHMARKVNPTSSDLENESIVAMLGKVLEMIRVNAAHSSPFHAFGYEHSALVHHVGGACTKWSLSQLDARVVIEVLQYKEGIASRPALRRERLRSAIASFKMDSDPFHQQFDKHFMRMVQQHMTDSSLFVRRLAYAAAGAGLRRLDEEKVLNAIDELVPPISPSLGAGAEFREWFERMDIGQLEGEGISTSTTMEASYSDIQLLMESDAVHCKATLARTTTNPGRFLRYLFEILMTTINRPDMEPVCLQALENISAARDYPSVDGMIERESVALLHLWVKSDTHEFPLALTSPGMLRRIVSNTNWAGGGVDTTRLRIEAKGNYIKRFRRYLVPLALFNAVQVFSSDPQSNDVDILSDSLTSDRNFKAICWVHTDDTDDSDCEKEDLEKVLRKHIPDICAFCYPLIQCEEQIYCQTGSDVLKLMNSILSAEVVETRTKRRSRTVVKRILELSGMACFLRETIPRMESPYIDAILAAVEDTALRDKEGGDVFLRVGTSATSILTRAVAKLETSSDGAHLESAWTPIELQCKLMISRINHDKPSNIQLGFFVHKLTEALLQSSAAHLRPAILRLLKEMLDKAYRHLERSIFQAETRPVMKRLLAACFHLHETCQKEFLHHCTSMFKNTRQHLRLGSGLLGLCRTEDDTDAWGWEEETATEIDVALSENGSTVEGAMRKSLEGTFEILTWTFANAAALELDPIAFLSLAPPYAFSSDVLEALNRYDTSFSAQTLAQSYLQNPGHAWSEMSLNANLLAADLRRDLNHHQAWIQRRPGSKSDSRYLESSTSLSRLIDQRLLLVQLTHLERALQGGDLMESYPQDLVFDLSYLCGPSSPDDLRVLASRCLGHLNPKLFLGLLDSDYARTADDWIGAALQNGTLIQSCQAMCLESLANCLKSSDSEVSLVAAETLEALFASERGNDVWHLIKMGPARGLLEPFTSSGKRIEVNGESPTLSAHDISLMKSRAGVTGESDGETKWCWDERMWQCFEQNGWSFEMWVCTLTPALIVCCLDDGTSTSTDNFSAFLWRCQRVCCLDHDFCCLLFPFLVLHLLEVNESANDAMLESLSNSCHVLLNQAPSAKTKCSPEKLPDRRALSLLLDTVDLLRRVSQADFLALGHKRNIMKLTRKHDSPASTSKRKAHNAGLPPPVQWRGLPFGVMLRLDVLVVARAGVYARRFALALFFLDLHFDSVLGKSGALFEEFPRESLRLGGDDGLHHTKRTTTMDGTGNDIGIENTKQSLLKAMEMASVCFESLSEHDASCATSEQRAAMQFEEHGWDEQTASQPLGDPQGELRSLNAQPGLPIQEHAVTAAMNMSALGYHQVLHSYLDSVMYRHEIVHLMSENNKKFLREKWFESALRRRQWASLTAGLEHKHNESAMSQAESLDGAVESLGATTTLPGLQDMGFFESVCRALVAFESDHVESYSSLLKQGRLSLIDDVGMFHGEESTVISVVGVIDKLRVLEYVESHLSPTTPAESGVTQAEYSEAVLQTMEESLQEDRRGASPELYGLIDSPTWIKELVLAEVHAKHAARQSPLCMKHFENLVSQICRSAVRCRLSGRPDVATESVQRLHALLDAHCHSCTEPNDDQVLVLRLEESKILECRGDFSGAIRKSQLVIEHLLRKEAVTGSLDAPMQRLLADGQISCGSWLTKYKVMQSSKVLESYLGPGAKRARNLFENIEKSPRNGSRLTQAHLELGQIVADLHDALTSRVASSDWKQSSSTAHQESELARCNPLRQQALVKRNKTKPSSREYDAVKRKWEELHIYCDNLKKDMERTIAERESVAKSIRRYLRLGITSFAAALSVADTGYEHDISRYVFRMVSLWFANRKAPIDNRNTINDLMVQALEQIPTFRFVPLTNQIFSRIEQASSSDEESFQKVLRMLVYRMCSDHPYHCIVPLLALANGKKVGSGVSGRHASAYIQNVGNSKVMPAETVMADLRKKAASYVGHLLENYATLADSYIHLAHADTGTFHRKVTKNVEFSRVYPKSMRTLDRCLVRGRSVVEFPPSIFTAPPPVQPRSNYGEGKEDPIGGERIRGFKPLFSITETGLHRPKIVVCLGTKGGEFRQLVKGEDEIRQDAIMEQVFTFVNNLMMRRNPGSDRGGAKSQGVARKMRIITYNIVPLSPASGVLEWVENTQAFGEYMLGRRSRIRSEDDPGAHSRYYPDDWNNVLCRKFLDESPPTEKRQSYDEICRRHSPCFRFFFVERFGHCMMSWHGAKMKYIRSVAVNSIVGHILGIGDRHTSNILVHQKTGEVVQIDFGIVFEQGKLLHTWERVPFRLTRNMIDGMGPCGTEGTLVRSAEETVRILRKNASALLTILSAVVADPLYKWSVNPVEARRRQTRTGDEENSPVEDHYGDKAGTDEASTTAQDRNEMGQKAIAKINDKLQGYEESTSGEQQGVEGQVQLLINSARDPDNLCEMFPGWAPWV